MPFYVFPIELGASAKRTKRAKRLNQGTLKSAPCFFVAISRTRSDDLRGLDLLNGRGIVDTHGVAVVTEQRTRHLRRWGVLSQEDSLVRELRAKGAVVLNEPRPKSQSIYVIELDPAVGKTRAARRLNPDRDPELPCIYVGRTGLEPETRFEQHQRGYRSSKWVHQYGTRLAPELNPELRRMNELDAYRAEPRVANRLRRQGLTVFGGH